MLEASRNAPRFADTIEYTMFAQASGITERVTFSVSAIYLYILENLQIHRTDTHI